MNVSGKASALIVCIAFFLGALLGFFGPRLYKKNSAPLPSAPVAVHDVKLTAPLKALDKAALRERGDITRATADDRNIEVLSTGRLEDDSGSRVVAAALDTRTGFTTLTEKRPLAEWMLRQELGLGYGVANGDLVRAAAYEATLGRIGPLYGSVRAEVFDRPTGTDWNMMAWATIRF